MLTAGDLTGPDVKAEGGSLTGKLAAGTAAVGAALGAGAMALSGKGSGSADVKVGCQFPQAVPARVFAQLEDDQKKFCLQPSAFVDPPIQLPFYLQCCCVRPHPPVSSPFGQVPDVDASVDVPSVDASVDVPSVSGDASLPSTSVDVPSVDASVEVPSVDASVDVPSVEVEKPKKGLFGRVFGGSSKGKIEVSFTCVPEPGLAALPRWLVVCRSPCQQPLVNKPLSCVARKVEGVFVKRFFFVLAPLASPQNPWLVEFRFRSQMPMCPSPKCRATCPYRMWAAPYRMFLLQCRALAETHPCRLGRQISRPWR